MFGLDEMITCMHIRGYPFYSGFGCRGGVSCVRTRLLFRISSRVMSILLFIPDFDKVEVAFYPGF